MTIDATNNDEIVDVNVDVNVQPMMNINVVSWNIESLASKLRSNRSEIYSLMQHFDIIGFIASFQTRDNEFDHEFDSNEWTIFSAMRTVCSKPAGGVTALVKRSLVLQHSVTKIFGADDRLYLCFKNIFSDKEHPNLIMGFIYLPPQGSIYYSSTDSESGVDLLAEDMFKIKNDTRYSNCRLLLAGDFNARTGVSVDYVIDDSVKYIPVLEDCEDELYNSDKFSKKRKNQDKEVNHFGKQLLELCAVEGIHFVNGRTNSDLSGNFTFVSNRGCSTIDYCIADSAMFEYISDFKVLDVDISLHLPIHCTLSVVKYSTEVMEVDVQLEHLSKFKWDMNKSVEYLQNICSTDVVLEINGIIELDDLSTEETVCKLRGVLERCGSHMEVKEKITEKNTEKTNQKWFDKECDLLKKKKCELLNKYRTTRAPEQLDEYLEYKKRFKDLCVKKEKDYRELMKNILCEATKDSTEFWKTIKLLKSSQSIVKRQSVISPRKWAEYFSNLFHKEEADTTIDDFTEHVNNRLKRHEESCDLCSCNTDEILNAEISEEEIQGLRNNKSPGQDGIPNEFYKYSNKNVRDLLRKLFNQVFNSGQFPESWNKKVIIPLFKKEDGEDPNNYRGISLLDSSSKIFTSVLNKRLNLWSETQGLIPEEQAGFRQGYSTIDNIFTLQSIVQKYLTKKRGKVYCAFIDFSKAFDYRP
ncbi:uncharacterized protein LOC134256716 [Saccostrea cucullata]|uniref:uncharacterized protein LOC134256716 n=1 Tax=Saccostrea cuccullata TaxID=36930 RepID=UPI002ED2777B